MHRRPFIALAAFTAFVPLTCIGFTGSNADLSRLDGAELKRAVSSLAARNHRPLTYRELWDVLKSADSHPSRQGFVIGLYSRAAISVHATEGTAPTSCDLTWKREHVWPKSKAFQRRDQLAHTDAHHIAAEVVRCNSLRGNLDFGEGGQLNDTYGHAVWFAPNG
jgi:endonuclease I